MNEQTNDITGTQLGNAIAEFVRAEVDRQMNGEEALQHFQRRLEEVERRRRGAA
jgi:hypothetical protein